jgi:hypothetical protein
VLKKYSDHPAAFIYLINFCTAMTCWLCVKMVRAHHVVKNPEPMSLKSLATGFRFIFAQRLILGMITLDMFAVFLGGATALLPVFAANEHLLNVGASGLGLLQAALPLGSVACALFLAHRRADAKSLVLVFVRDARAGGAVDNVSVVVRQTLVQILTPDEKRGRVSAVNSLFIGTSNELGGFRSGFVAYLSVHGVADRRLGSCPRDGRDHLHRERRHRDDSGGAGRGVDLAGNPEIRKAGVSLMILEFLVQPGFVLGLFVLGRRARSAARLAAIEKLTG